MSNSTIETDELPSLADAFLAGLQEDNQLPSQADERFAQRQLAIEDDDYFDIPGSGNVTANWEVANVFCPTGLGGGIDPSCSPHEPYGGSSLPKEPHFISSNKQNVAENLKAVAEMKALALKGDVKGLKAHPGTGSPKIEIYRKELLKVIKPTAEKPQLELKPVKPVAEEPKASANLESAIAHVVKATGYSKTELKEGLATNYTMRAKVAGALLTSGNAVTNAVHGVTLGDPSRIEKITSGDSSNAKIQFQEIPKFDLGVIRNLVQHKGPVHGEATAQMASGEINCGSTTRPGSYRHELGHVLHGTMGGGKPGQAKVDGQTEMNAAVTNEFNKVQERVKANPIGLTTKQSHEWYEANYGAVGRRCLDNEKENLAEHYRVYHKYLYQDKHEGGDGKALAGYRARHPGWAKIWDAHYTAVRIHEELNNG